MNPKSFSSIIFLLNSSVIVLLAPAVRSSTNSHAVNGPSPKPAHYACTNFQASWEAPSGPDANKLNAKLWTLVVWGSNSTWSGGAIPDPDCWADKVEVGPDGRCTLTCIPGFECIFDTIYDGYSHLNYMSYTMPKINGAFAFIVDWHEESQMWYRCPDCKPADCYVPTNSVIQAFYLSP